MLKIAVWDLSVCDFLFGELSDFGFEVVKAPIDQCSVLLRSGEVDCALVSPAELFSDVEQFRVMKGFALVSDNAFPYFTLAFSDGLERIRTAAADPAIKPLGYVAEIVLREQYGLERGVTYQETIGTNGSTPDVVAAVRNPSVQTEPGIVLDMGLEWLGLTEQPMAWGLLALPPASTDFAAASQLVSLVREGVTSERTASWLVEHPDTSDQETAFLNNDLRVTLDDDVAAGLDHLAHHMFYFGIVDDIPSLQYAGVRRNGTA